MTYSHSKHPNWGGSVAPSKCEVCGSNEATICLIPKYPAIESERVYYLCVSCLVRHCQMALTLGYETYLSDGGEGEPFYIPKRQHKGRNTYERDPQGRVK